MSNVFWLDFPGNAIPDGIYRKGRSVLLIMDHSEFKGGEWFEVLGLRVEFPFVDGPAIIAYYRITVAYSTLVVKES